MDNVKDVVNGEEVVENEEEKQDKNIAPAGSVKPDVNKPNPDTDDVDEDGVPWKNRFHELKRKTAERLAKLEESLQNQRQPVYTPPTEPPEPQEDEFTKEQKRIASFEAQKVIQEERYADTECEKLLDNLANTNEYVKMFKLEIRNELQRLRPSVRSNPEAIRRISNSVIGEHAQEIVKIQSEKARIEKEKLEKNKKLSDVPAKTLESVSAGGGDGGKVTLTADEIDFADDKGLWDKGYTNEEIRDIYKKRLERLEKQKKDKDKK